MQHDALVSRQDPAIAVAFGLGGNVVQLVARVPLHMRERHQHFTAHNLGQHLCLLRLAAGIAYQAAAEDHGGEVRLHHEATPECLHYDHRLDRTAAEPTMLLCKGHAEQPEFGVLLPHLA